VPVSYDPAAEAAFYSSISNAPKALKTFFDKVAGHFRARSDTSVAYTFSNGRKGQMRISGPPHRPCIERVFQMFPNFGRFATGLRPCW
jgi:hypothetical protein